jgi:hypothetical protein
VGTEDSYSLTWNFFQSFDKYRTFFGQAIYYMGIMDDFMQDIYRCAVFFQSLIDDGNGSFDSCTKSPWVGKKNFHLVPLKEKYDENYGEKVRDCENIVT